MKITTVFFSATNTTQTITSAIAHNISDDVVFHNIINHPVPETVNIPSDELFIVGMPVYAGRIPAVAVDSLNKYMGNDTPAIIIAVYGNREFDDALVEMQDILEPNGFSIIAAGAFIAQHSIFPHTAKGRPDNADFQKIDQFSKLCISMLKSTSEHKKIKLPGHRPYKIPGKVPLEIKTNNKCINCGICVAECPVQAIPIDDPRHTDYTKCIRCGHCITVCHRQARHYSGLLYHIAGYKFHKKNKVRKDPEFFFPELKSSVCV